MVGGREQWEELEVRESGGGGGSNRRKSRREKRAGGVGRGGSRRRSHLGRGMTAIFRGWDGV